MNDRRAAGRLLRGGAVVLGALVMLYGALMTVLFCCWLLLPRVWCDIDGCTRNSIWTRMMGVSGLLLAAVQASVVPFASWHVAMRRQPARRWVLVTLAVLVGTAVWVAIAWTVPWPGLRGLSD